MSEWTVLVLILPIVLIITGAVMIITVALLRAAPADIPLVLGTAHAIICRLADFLPVRGRRVDQIGQQGGYADDQIGQQGGRTDPRPARLEEAQ